MLVSFYDVVLKHRNDTLYRYHGAIFDKAQCTLIPREVMFLVLVQTKHMKE